MTEIDYYYFPLSPYCYAAGLGLEEIAARHGAKINYRPFNLIRLFQETGTAMPKDRPIARQKYRLKDIARSAKMAGLPVNVQPAHWPTNPVPVSSAIIVADSVGGGDTGKLCHGFCRAVWAEEKNIADEEVVASCLEAAGFDANQDPAALEAASKTIEANTDEALKNHVFGAPTYIVGDELFWGNDRLAFLDAHLAELKAG
ncbi:2-hydroxychromene-2-carboxylate isomerase [Amaricoccus tamworthensis]|uniref:2-hydroxychromene-2-carboxylate isomerase n=1 Tax=Amaricoccus tamworthensis TaxID=57002 RepID=UPI003C7E48BF